MTSIRLERWREYERRRLATMTTEQRHNLLWQRRESYQRTRCNETESFVSTQKTRDHHEIASFNDPHIVSK